MSRAREGGLGLGFVAELRVEADIGLCFVEQARRVGFRRRHRVGHGGEGLIVDLDLLGSVLGRRDCPGDDDGDRLADIADFVDRQRIMRRGEHRRAVAVDRLDLRRMGQERNMRNRFQAVGQQVLAGEHGQTRRARPWRS